MPPIIWCREAGRRRDSKVFSCQSCCSSSVYIQILRLEIANYIPDSSIEMEMTPNGMCVRNRNRYISNSKTGDLTSNSDFYIFSKL